MTEDTISEETDPFGDPASAGLPHDARVALATLLAQRFITRPTHRSAWDALLAYRPEIEERLEDLFMTLEIDLDFEVAFKRQSTEDGSPAMLRRDKPLGRDATLLMIFLRQEHAFTDAADDAVVVTRDQITEFLHRFSYPQSDPMALGSRVNSAISALTKPLGLLDPDPDGDNFVVSPAIVPLINTDVLAHLRATFEISIPEAAAEDTAAPATTESMETTDA